MTDSLPDYMEFAAGVLERATLRRRSEGEAVMAWSPEALQRLAKTWRAEDEGRQRLRDELARFISNASAKFNGSTDKTADALLGAYNINPRSDHRGEVVGGPAVMTGVPTNWSQVPEAGAHDYSEGPPSDPLTEGPW